MYISINGIAILNIHGVDYCCVTVGTSISETINLFKNSDFRENTGSL